jgi:UDPglucose 6-dehydrogenase
MSEIVIIGATVVGTATGKGFAAHGHPVRFVDVDPARVEALRADGYQASGEIELPDTPAFIFLTLPTPNVGHRYDLDAFTTGTREVGDALKRAEAFHTVVVRSTVPPGTCEGRVGPLLQEQSGKLVDEGFGLCSNPEFLRAASAVEDFLFPWMTVIGSRSRATIERMRNLFAPLGGELRTFDDPAAAEMVKCSHNLYNAAKISFWNEMWLVARRMGLPADDIAATVARSSEGSVNPGYGIRGGAPYGGACLPKDTKGFLGFTGDLGIDMPLLDAVVEVNERMIRAASAKDLGDPGDLTDLEDLGDLAGERVISLTDGAPGDGAVSEAR